MKSDYKANDLLKKLKYMEETSLAYAASNIVWGISLWAILTYFWMSSEVLIILTSVLILDWIFWVINAYLQNTLESKIMARWLIKKMSRWCVPFIVIAVMRGAGFDNIHMISNTLLSILIVAEWYSIIWHIYSINYWKTLPEIDAFKMLMEWLSNILKWKVEQSIGKEEKEEKDK